MITLEQRKVDFDSLIQQPSLLIDKASVISALERDEKHIFYSQKRKLDLVLSPRFQKKNEKLFKLAKLCLLVGLFVSWGACFFFADILQQSFTWWLGALLIPIVIGDFKLLGRTHYTTNLSYGFLSVVTPASVLSVLYFTIGSLLSDTPIFMDFLPLAFGAVLMFSIEFVAVTMFRLYISQNFDSLWNELLDELDLNMFNFEGEFESAKITRL